MAALTIILVVLALNYAKAQTKFKKCADGSPTPNSFQFSDCLEKCIVVGDDVTEFKMDFTAPFAASEIDVYFDLVTSTNIRNVTRYTLPEPGCSNLVNGGCPIAAGDNITLNSMAGVVDFGKEVVVLVEVRIESENGPLSCASIPILDIKRPASLNATTAP